MELKTDLPARLMLRLHVLPKGLEGLRCLG